MHPMSADRPSTPAYAPAYAPAPAPAAALPPTRPKVLTLAVTTSLATGLLTLVAQALGLLGGKGAIEDELTTALGADGDLVGGLVAAAVDEAYRTIQVRAGLGVFLAVVVLVLALASRNASRAARILLAVTLTVSALLTLVVVADVFPTAGVVAGALALLLTPVALVLLFLPPANRYRTARRAAAR
jgi:hypothetical protein